MLSRLRTSYDPVFRVPKSGSYFQCKHDFESSAWEYLPRSIALKYKKDPPANALPETVPYFGCKAHGDFVPLNEAWQWFWFELLAKSAPSKSQSKLLAAWESLTANARALTDQHAVQNGYADYITGKNLGSKPIEIKCLGFGGNLVKWTGKYQGGMMQIEVLNGSKSPPDVRDVWGKWWLVGWCTEETVLELPDHRYQVGRFPQLSPFGSPYPCISLSGYNLVEKERVKAVTNGSYFSPYLYH